MTATKIQPGDDLHLTSLMAPHSLNFVTGADRAALLAYGRDVFAAALDSKCLAQIEEPAGAAPAAVAPQGVVAWMTPEGDRVVTAETMDGARKDGGASLSSLRPYTVALVRGAVAPALEAPAAHAPALPDGWRLVPIEFLRGFGTLAHNYSLTAIAPDHYWGNERSAFSDAYARCGQDLGRLRDMLSAEAPPLAAAPQAPAAPSDYTLVDEGGPGELAGAQAQYSIERADGTTLAWINGDKAAAEELMAALRLPMPISRSEWIAEVRSFLCQGGWDEPVAISTARDLSESQDWLGQDIEDPRDAAWNAFLEDMRQAPHSDDLAVDRFAAEMKAKLAAARAKGRGGWETCPPEVLSRMLREHTDKGDPRDVANFCMFLWSLGQPIVAAPAAPAVDAETIEDAARFRAIANAGLTDDEAFDRALEKYPELGGDATIDDVRAMFDAARAAVAAQAKKGGE